MQQNHKNDDQLKNIINKSPEKLLMYHHDPLTYQKLKLIMEQYGDEKNPLYKYYEETGNYLTKYSKKDNGPVIKKIKYYVKKTYVYKDITKNYLKSRNKVVKLTLNPYRFDVYLDNDVYKFVTVKHLDVTKKEKYYEVNSQYYEEAKRIKKISNQAEFIASFYKNDLIKIDGELYKVTGVNNDLPNLIEINMVDITYKEYLENMNDKRKDKRLIKKITNKTKSIKKYSTDILGNLYEAKSKQDPQMIMKR